MATSHSEELLERQNPDGGWSYQRGGGSWTEPTCYALMALASEGLADSDAGRRCALWLTSSQRADGAWSPRPGTDQGTWVTAAVLLVPPNLANGIDRARASAWLLSQTGRESSLVQRLRMFLLGVKSDTSVKFDGWPWYPGAAAWVGPTALSILALEKLNRTDKQSKIEERLEQGRSFLLARRCRDGGWNHGSTRALGYDSDSYPETTGLALLALHSVSTPAMNSAVTIAEQHLDRAASLEAACWLRLGLRARGIQPAEKALPEHDLKTRNTTEIALAALADAAAHGRNLFVE